MSISAAGDSRPSRRDRNTAASSSPITAFTPARPFPRWNSRSRSPATVAPSMFRSGMSASSTAYSPARSRRRGSAAQRPVCVEVPPHAAAAVRPGARLERQQRRRRSGPAAGARAPRHRACRACVARDRPAAPRAGSARGAPARPPTRETPPARARRRRPRRCDPPVRTRPLAAETYRAPPDPRGTSSVSSRSLCACSVKRDGRRGGPVSRPARRYQVRAVTRCNRTRAGRPARPWPAPPGRRRRGRSAPASRAR